MRGLDDSGGDDGFWRIPVAELAGLVDGRLVEQSFRGGDFRREVENGDEGSLWPSLAEDVVVTEFGVGGAAGGGWSVGDWSERVVGPVGRRRPGVQNMCLH